MFKFLKDKLKGAISKISKKAEEETEEKPSEEGVIEKEKIEEKEPLGKEESTEKPEEETIGQQLKKTIDKKTTEKEESKKEAIKEKTVDKEEIEQQLGETKEQETVREESIEKKPLEEKESESTIKKEEKIESKAEPEEKKRFFGKLTEKITTTKISYEKFESMFSDLELILMENNVAMEVIDKIKDDLTENIVEKPIKRGKIEEMIKDSLRNSIEDLFNVEKVNLLKSIKNSDEKPFVIAFFGINGSGKTTSIAKVANMLKEEGLSVVLAAADTFRAASMEQLQRHADKLGVKMIKHDYGSDPAAVAFDAIKHAKSKNTDVVLVDTAGRLHSQGNLMEEMKKIIRISKPDLKVFVGESITGNDCVEQAKSFNDAVGIDGLILTKADVDEKGGAAISISYVTKKPILYLGIGQEYNDLKAFDSNIVVEGLGL